VFSTKKVAELPTNSTQYTRAFRVLIELSGVMVRSQSLSIEMSHLMHTCSYSMLRMIFFIKATSSPPAFLMQPLSDRGEGLKTSRRSTLTRLSPQVHLSLVIHLSTEGYCTQNVLECHHKLNSPSDQGPGVGGGGGILQIRPAWLSAAACHHFSHHKERQENMRMNPAELGTPPWPLLEDPPPHPLP